MSSGPSTIAELVAARGHIGVTAGLPKDAAQVGDLMPDGDLLDVKGNTTTLAQAREGRPAVMVFYRGAWCPYRNLTLKAYQTQLVPGLN